MRPLFLFITFLVGLFLFYAQASEWGGGYKSDLPAHVSIARQYAAGEAEVTHGGFHLIVWVVRLLTDLDWDYAAAITLAGFLTLTAYFLTLQLAPLLGPRYSHRYSDRGTQGTLRFLLPPS